MALAMFKVPLPLVLSSMNPRSPIRRSLWASLFPLDKERVYARNFEIPSGGGVGTARAMAQAYGEFAAGGRRLGLKEETLKELMAPAIPPLRGFRDEALKVDAPFSLGFSKPNEGNPFGHPGSFGAPGSGGSFGFADPEAQIGYGYVLNRADTYLVDPRDVALRAAVYRSIGDPDPYQ
jgi:CubicO group peptidase (beta-lactamase class C family)